MTRKLTIRDLRELKGVRQLTDIHVRTAEDAAAAQAAGLDMICASYKPGSAAIRAAAPGIHITYALPRFRCVSADEHIRAAFDAMEEGADSIYTSTSVEIVAAMARQRVPVVGHVGLIPNHATWFGGMRAVGKTADEALRLLDDVRRYEDAGAVAIEIEIVPEPVATLIARNTPLSVISMGAGAGCDVQYLFSDDILGETVGHMPRHAKAYRDFRSEYARLQAERVEAFRDYARDVAGGQFPGPQHLVKMPPAEQADFLHRAAARGLVVPDGVALPGGGAA